MSTWAAIRLGRLDDLASPGERPMVVSPCLRGMRTPVTIDPAEVAAHYWFNLQRLVDGEGVRRFATPTRGVRLTCPVDLMGTHRGITLGIVDDLVGRLSAKSG